MRGLNGLLRQVFSVPAASPDPALESRLLEQFDRQVPKEKSMKRMVRRVAFGAAAVAGLGILACGAPAEVDVAGTFLTVRVPAGMELPGHDTLHGVIASRNASEVDAKMKRTPEGITLEVTLWDENPETAETLTQALLRVAPSLATAEIREEPLSANVKVSLAEKIGHEWLEADLAAGNIEAAKQRLIDDLRAREGDDAQIDVQIQDDGEGRREVQVKVKKVVETPDQ